MTGPPHSLLKLWLLHEEAHTPLTLTSEGGRYTDRQRYRGTERQRDQDGERETETERERRRE